MLRVFRSQTYTFFDFVVPTTFPDGCTCFAFWDQLIGPARSHPSDTKAVGQTVKRKRAGYTVSLFQFSSRLFSFRPMVAFKSSFEFKTFDRSLLLNQTQVAASSSSISNARNLGCPFGRINLTFCHLWSFFFFLHPEHCAILLIHTFH